MSERNVLKLDINGLTDFQKELHYPDNHASDKKPKHINSIFSCIIQKNAWSAHAKAKMNHVKGEDGNVIYTASGKFDVIFNTNFRY